MITGYFNCEFRCRIMADVGVRLFFLFSTGIALWIVAPYCRVIFWTQSVNNTLYKQKNRTFLESFN